MKKSLLILGTLVLSVSVNAQATTYVGNNAKFYVSQQASVYSGGEWKLDSGVEKSVLNEGSIVILEKYTKGSNNSADGKEFLNKYIGEKNYGQVKILNTSTATDTNARMTMEKPAAHSNYYGASYAISFPYNDNVKYVMHSFKKEESDFKGTCQRGTQCADRYKMTLTKWNNDKLQHDAVLAEDTFVAGDYYNINLRETNMQTAMKGNIFYKGQPDGKSYSKTAKGIISSYKNNEQEFSNAGYNEWKKRTNEYNESYESYIGYRDTNNKFYGKNVYRFGNPYTSNIDISEVEGENAWLKIIKNGGEEKTLKEAHIGKWVRGFYITKRASDYNISWDRKKGGIIETASYHKAEFDGNMWIGSAEALLIRPFETFNLNFRNVSNPNLGSRILNVKVELKDVHKTFNYVAGKSSNMNTAATLITNSVMNIETLSNNVSDKFSNRSNNVYDFNQLEIFLIEENKIVASPAYIVGANYYKESGEKRINLDRVFVYGVEEKERIAYDSQKSFNSFNSKDYIAKPLGIGFNGLIEGNTYQLRFNLYESSIFNKVANLSDGVFFLKDTLENKAVKIDTNKSYTFVANGEVDKRFVVYWKKLPSVDDTIVDTIEKKDSAKKTVVYKDGRANKVRFETNELKAKVDVYNAAGRLVSSEQDISTDTDYTLNLDAQGMYVVRVVYYNGEVRVLKVMNY